MSGGRHPVEERVQKHRWTTEERVDKFLSDIYWQDCNIHGRRVLARDAKAVRLRAWHCADGSRPSVDEAIEQARARATEISVGHEFGPLWCTAWVEARVRLPPALVAEKHKGGVELRLVWDAGCEGMLYDAGGAPLQGLNGGGGHLRRADFTLPSDPTGTGPTTLGEADEAVFWVEVACNSLVGDGSPTMISPPDAGRRFKLERAEVVAWDTLADEVCVLLGLLHKLATELPKGHPRAARALYIANDVVNRVAPGDRGTYPPVIATMRSFLAQPPAPDAPLATCVGHCHIDCAWLWPYAEAKRKVARSWASQLALLERHPTMVFAASSAQHFQWLMDEHPQLYERVREAVRGGRFLPVGGTWVEMDGVMPSGESLCRQFLMGQRFFMEEFGRACETFWLPDSFGYAGCLPQVMQLAGCRYFVTQKLSWNLVNKPRHTSFVWEGIDGRSRVVGHFPPNDDYGSQATVADLVKWQGGHKDLDRAPGGLFLYGNGDGGGGPTPEMCDRLRQLKSCDGLPRLEHAPPEDFFRRVDADALCVHRGELYLELHRGALTSQARTKRLHRRCEAALCAADTAAAASIALGGRPLGGAAGGGCPTAPLWTRLLRHQFHDVLPGTSIGDVHREVEADLSSLYDEAKRYLTQQLHALEPLVARHDPAAGDAGAERQRSPARPAPAKRRRVGEVVLWNPLPFARAEVAGGRLRSFAACGGELAAAIDAAAERVTVRRGGGTVVLQNAAVRCAIDAATGAVVSLRGADAVELVPPGQAGNVLCLHDDVPFFWDAWDVESYHMQKYVTLNSPGDSSAVGRCTVSVADESPLSCSVRVQVRVSDASRVTQTVSLDARSAFVCFDTSVDWHESHKLLKVVFPTRVVAQSCIYDAACGVHERPTHFNSAEDAAKFECCGHRFATLQQHGLGLSILNDSKYGMACHGGTLKLSLLRSPKAPDADCDMGPHHFVYAAMPHRGDADRCKVLEAAGAINQPLHALPSGDAPLPSLLSVPAQLGLMCFKPAEVPLSAREGCGPAVVLRFCEMAGGHAPRAELAVRTVRRVARVRRCDILERPLPGGELPRLRAPRGGAEGLSEEPDDGDGDGDGAEPAGWRQDAGSGVVRIWVGAEPYQITTLRVEFDPRAAWGEKFPDGAADGAPGRGRPPPRLPKPPGMQA